MSLEEWVRLPFGSDGGLWTVAWDDGNVIGKGEEGVVDGFDELAGVAAGEIGSANGAGEEGVSREEKSLLGEIEADAAFGVAGGVEDGAGQASNGNDLAIFEVGVRRGHFRGRDSEPSGLNVHHFDQGQIVLVVEDRRSGELFEALRSGDMVDVSVGDDDLLYGEVVMLQSADDAGDVVAGINDDGLAGGFVAEDGAIALKGADDEDFVDHGLRVRLNTDLHR
jgi:hypothetical protein